MKLLPVLIQRLKPVLYQRSTLLSFRLFADCRGVRQLEIGIQRWIDVGPIVYFCLGS